MASRVVTCDPALDARSHGTLGDLENAAVVVEDGRISFVGPAELAAPHVTLEDLGARVITPGLVDAHTHACWIGSRHLEYADRMSGRSYSDAARGGGGILATASAVGAATEQELAQVLGQRLVRMASLGVTTVEVKSGYGLVPAEERKQLEAIRTAASLDGVPSVVATLLALHALPHPTHPRADYVAHVASELIPAVARERLARFVDAYVDAGAFAVPEARIVAEAARAAGLGLRFHAGQFADLGGAELAATLGACSVDHLEHVSKAAVDALVKAGVKGVLLPTASWTLGDPAPPVAMMRRAGLELVVASDANPGTAPTESLPLALALAVRNYGLSPEEALLGATRIAAAALELEDRGILRAGLRADLACWDLPHEYAIVQPWGVARTHCVLGGGRRLDRA
jgi:imidazolonepropionase